MNEQSEINVLLKKLFSKFRLGIKPGLERSHQLDKESNCPHSCYKTIHIAGTNGKGSVASMFSSYLIELGYSVGLYTSPHIFRFNERIRVNGKEISDQSIIDIYKNMEDKSEEIEATFFEITSAIAFDYFKVEKVDYAIIETGMGGRFDSTNIIKPELSVITSISIDHQEFLGDNISQIAKEKAGIIKSETPVIYYSENTLVKYEIESKALELNSETLNVAEKSQLKELKFDKGISFEIDGQIIKTKFINEYQLININLVVASISKLFSKIDTDKLQLTFDNLQINSGLKYRSEVISESPLIIADVAHNKEAIDALCQTIKKRFNYKTNSNNNPNKSLNKHRHKRFNIIFAVMSDKDIEAMLACLSEISKQFIFTQVNTQRSLDIDKLNTLTDKYKYNKISFLEPKQAYKYAQNLSEDFIVCGSFYLLSEVFGDEVST